MLFFELKYIHQAYYQLNTIIGHWILEVYLVIVLLLFNRTDGTSTPTFFTIYIYLFCDNATVLRLVFKIYLG